MEISGTNMGAATYAMKKAMDMPNSLLKLVQQTADSGKQSLNSLTATESLDLALTTGKGKIINIVA